MALKTVSQLEDSVAAILSGIDLTNVDNLNGCLERAARTMVQKADIPEASNIQNITLYAGVTDYACDTRIFGTAINDIRPQGISRNAWNTVVKIDQEDFDRTKLYYPSGTRSTFQYLNGIPTIRIVAPFPVHQVIIDPMNQIGTSPNQWITAGTASGLSQDVTNFYQSPASLRFTVTGLGTGILTKTLQSPLTLSSYQGVGVAFLAIQIPSGTVATALATLSLKIGSSSTNYNLVTQSTGFLGSWISGQWLLVAFDFAAASIVGTPDWNAITYVQVLAGTLSTITNFRVGGLFMALPSPAQILYQSAAIYLPIGSVTALTTITEKTDQIVLNDPAYTIYEYESALAVLQQTGGGAADSTVVRITGILEGAGNNPGLYAMFRGDNPSQEIRTTGSWYDTDTSYNSLC